MDNQRLNTVFYIILLAGALANARCPERCSCPLDGVVDCSSQDLTRIPPEIPANTKILNMSDNNVSLLNLATFVNVSHLQTLDLSRNNIHDIESYAFRELKQLKRLNLRQNKLEELEANIFNGIKCCKHLRYTCITDMATGDCFIDLSFNNIRNVREYAFNNTQFVDIFLGQQNVPLTVKSFAFSGYENGNSLALRNIPSLDFNTLAFYGMKNTTLLYVENATIPVLRTRFLYGPSQSLSRILFKNCHLPEIQRNAFSDIKFKLDNHSKANSSTLPSAEDFCSDEEERIGNIEIWDSNINKIQFHTFYGSNVRNIFLFRNSIKQIEPYAFLGLKHLKNFKFSRNRIPKLFTKSFGNLRNVNCVELNDNNFQEIENNAFQRSYGIGKLTFSMKNTNASELTIRSQAFRGLSSTKLLYFKNINLIFKSYSFSGISNLGTLLMENINPGKNKTVFPRNMFSGMLVNRIHIQSKGSLKVETGAFDSLAIQYMNLEFLQLPCDCEAPQLEKALRSVVSEFNVACRKTPMSAPVLISNTEFQNFEFTDCGAGNSSHKQEYSLILLISSIFLSLNHPFVEATFEIF